MPQPHFYFRAMHKSVAFAQVNWGLTMWFRRFPVPAAKCMPRSPQELMWSAPRMWSIAFLLVEVHKRQDFLM